MRSHSIVSVRSHERFVGQCLRPLLSQIFSRDEYGIVDIDDCSTDVTEDGLEFFRDEISPIWNVEHVGLPASLNRGIWDIVRLDSNDHESSDFPPHSVVGDSEQIVARMTSAVDAVMPEGRDLGLRFLRQYEIHRLEQPSYNYRCPEISGSNETHAMEYCQAQLAQRHEAML